MPLDMIVGFISREELIIIFEKMYILTEVKYPITDHLLYDGQVSEIELAYNSISVCFYV